MAFIEGPLIDLDGTLIDGSAAQSHAWALAAQAVLGASLRLEDLEYHGHTSRSIAAQLQQVAGVTGAEGRLVTAHAIALNQVEEDIVALPGAREFLLDLVEMGWSPQIVTGNGFKASECLLARAGLNGLARIAGTGEHSEIRQHIIQYAVDKVGWHAPVVGDTPMDCSAATAAGCAALGVATGAYSVDELEEAGTTLVVPDLVSGRGVILAWLAEHSPFGMGAR